MSTTDGLDLRTPLRQVATTGAAFIACALNEESRRALFEEVGGGPFIAVPERLGPKAVRQQADAFDVQGDMTAYPLLGELREDLVGLVRDHGSGIAGLDKWLPNHAAVQRYQPGTQGISPHLDGRRYRYLVAIFTVTGSAGFSLCADRAGTVIRQWQAGAGSLMLMRGPGLAAMTDGRPLHTVGGPIQEARVSVTYRMDTNPATSYDPAPPGPGAIEREDAQAKVQALIERASRRLRAPPSKPSTPNSGPPGDGILG